MAGIDVFVEPEGRSPVQFRRDFLRSPEFRKQELAAIAGVPSSRTRDELLSVIRSLEGSSSDLDMRIMHAVAERRRPWLTFFEGNVSTCPNLGDPRLLATGSPDEGWFGPLKSSDNYTFWYIRYFRISHWLPDPDADDPAEAQPVHRWARWLVVAEVTSSYTAFTWRNFTIGREDDTRTEAVPYWDYLPQAIDELRKKLNATWSEPRMYDLVLQKMWNRYINDADWSWQHYRIRAEEDRVAVNARSVKAGSDGSAEMKGLEKLAQLLAKAALKEVGAPTGGPQAASMRNALLHTLIRDWSPKSYEFFLHRNGAGRDQQLHVHCFFGARPDERTKDRFQHFHCMATAGESEQALRRLLEELRR